MRPPFPFREVALVVASFGFWGLNCSATLGPRGFAQESQRVSTDLEFDLLKALRAAQAYETAEGMCQRKLRSASPGSPDAAQWTIRLSAVRVDVALANDSAELWQAAAEPCRSFLKSYPQSERALWVGYQAGLVDLAAARDAVLSLLAAASPDKTRPLVLQIVRRATESLSAMTQAIGQRELPAGVTAEEFRALSADATLSLATATLLRMRCYPDKSDDALAAAGEAESIALNVLRQWPVGTEKGGQATRIRVLAKLAISDQLGAKELSKRLLQSDDPENLAAAARVYLAENQLSEADAILARSPIPHGEIELVRLELILARMPQGSEVSAQLARIEAQFGRYWRRRAELELLAKSATRTTTPELDATRALQLLGQEKYEEAANLLTQAAAGQRRMGANDLATNLQIRAGAAWLKAGLREKAIEVLRTTALESPQSPQAPAVHLQAAWLLGQQPAGKQPAGVQSAEKQPAGQILQFAEILGEHLEQWPDDRTSDQVIAWLYEFVRPAEQSVNIAEILLRVPPSSRRSQEVVEHAGREFQLQLRTMWLDSPAVAEGKALAAAQRFRDYVQPPAVNPQLETKRRALTHAAKLELLFQGNSADGTGAELPAVLQKISTLRQGATLGLVEFGEILQGTPDSERPLLTDAARRLVRDGRAARVPPTGNFGQAVERLLDHGPDLGDGLWLRAHAKGWSNDWSSAVDLALRIEPIGEFTVETVGGYWSGLPLRSANEAALKLWDQQATKVPLGSDRWLSARLQTSRSLISLGRLDEARQVIALVLVSAPEAKTQAFRELLSPASGSAVNE